MSLVERLRWKLVHALFFLLHYCPAAPVPAPDTLVVVFTRDGDPNLRLLASPEFDVAVVNYDAPTTFTAPRAYDAIQMVFVDMAESDIDAISDCLPPEQPVLRGAWVMRERIITSAFWVFEYEILARGDIPAVDFVLTHARHRIRELVKYKIGRR